MSAQTHLAQYGVTLDQARAFIYDNIGSPGIIFSTCQAYGVTNDMLAEIVGGGVTVADVQGFWASQGFNASLLNGEDGGGSSGGGGGDLSSIDLSLLAQLVFSNADSTGVLSTAAIRERVIAQTGADDYNRAFDPSTYDGAGDGTFTAAELGLPQFANLPATAETLENLLYGSIVKTLKNLGLDDQADFLALSNFIAANQTGIESGDPSLINQFVQYAVAIYGDATAQPLLSDQQIADVAVLTGVVFVDGYESGLTLADGLLSGFLG